MIDIHPTETGGDGRPLRRFSTDKPGAVKDDRIRCAQCGFPFRTARDAKGDTQDSPGITQADETVSISNTQAKIPIHLQGLSAFSASSRDVPTPTVESGCRFCGTYNPEGRQSKEFDVGHKDMSGL